MLPGNRCKRLAWIVLAIAFGCRLIAAGGVQTYLNREPGREFVIAGDAEGYWELAKDLAHGRDYAVYSPPRRVMRMPAFPAILAGSIVCFGESLWAARLVLACVGTAACGLVFLLGRALFDERVGLLASAWTAVSPTLVGFSVLILSETVFAFAILLQLWLMALLYRRHLERAAFQSSEGGRRMNLGLAFAVGAAGGFACLVRPSWLLVPPGIAVLWWWLAGRNRFRMYEAALLCAGCVAVLTPWTIRNFRVTGHFVPTTLWMGASLYDGLNPEATGDSDMAFFESDRLATDRGMTEYAVDRYYRKLAVDYAFEHPGRAVQLALVKLGRYWSPWPNADQFRHPLAGGLVFLSSVPLFVGAAIGIARRQAGGWRGILTAAPIVYFAAIHAVFVGSIRYRLPTEYPLAVLAAAGIIGVWHSRRGNTMAERTADAGHRG